MRWVKRDRFGIIAEVLQIAKSGAKMTRIMYSCNLSYGMTKGLLAHLLKTGLLREGNSFQTTEKGLQFLESYRALDSLLNTSQEMRTYDKN